MLGGAEGFGTELRDDDRKQKILLLLVSHGLCENGHQACLTTGWSKEKGYSLRFITPSLVMESGGIHTLVVFLLREIQ